MVVLGALGLAATLLLCALLYLTSRLPAAIQSSPEGVGRRRLPLGFTVRNIGTQRVLSAKVDSIALAHLEMGHCRSLGRAVHLGETVQVTFKNGAAGSLDGGLPITVNVTKVARGYYRVINLVFAIP